MASPVLPPLSTAITVGTNTLVGLRPQAEPFVVSGVWGRVFDGWKAQLAKLRARAADELRASRLASASEDSLRELAASEFYASLPSDPTRAVGTVTLTRPFAGDMQGGPIAQGFRFKLNADPAASPPVQGAAYESTAPIWVNATDTTVYVPIQGTTTGPGGNIPRYQGRAAPAIVLADTLPDPLSTFTVAGSDAAGGSSGVEDADLRQLCSAMAAGQWNATDPALLAGSLLDAGVKHAIMLDDITLGQVILRVADVSWASSAMLQRRVLQALKDHPWLGFGCRASVQPIYNRLIAVRADVMLTDPKHTASMQEIQANISKALRAYFDNRKKFYLVYAESIGGVIARADERIMSCPAAHVVDVHTGVEFTYTPAQAAANRVHWYLTDDALSLSVKAAS
jgi:hypothetical protein